MFEKRYYKGIAVSYEPHLRGGGDNCGQQFRSVVKTTIGPVEHAFEYCAGCGFIGFSLLAYGFCRKLTVADVNPEAVRCLKETVKENGLEDRVSVYLSDALADIPRTERWDIVVSNQPHLLSTKAEYQKNIKAYDPDFSVH